MGNHISMGGGFAADANATHQSVVQVMDVAGKLVFLNINISTVVPQGQPLPP